jgi:pyridoxine 5-phosphate synthase
MVDHDIFQLKKALTTKLNLEMGIAPDIVAIALDVVPHDVCLVPENRQEVTTEGGLDCASSFDRLLPIVTSLRDRGIRVSLFIDPDTAQVESTARLGAEFIELHTGAYANAANPEPELARLHEAAVLAGKLGLRVNAGHGLNYTNVGPICELPGIEELNIGHSIISRAVFSGLAEAVRTMADLVSRPLRK